MPSSIAKAMKARAIYGYSMPDAKASAASPLKVWKKNKRRDAARDKAKEERQRKYEAIIKRRQDEERAIQNLPKDERMQVRKQQEEEKKRARM